MILIFYFYIMLKNILTPLLLLFIISSCSLFTKKDWQIYDNQNNINVQSSWDAEWFIDRSDEWAIFTSDDGDVTWDSPTIDEEWSLSWKNPFNF